MKDFLRKIGKPLENKWVKFALVAVLYVLWFVVWSRNVWMLLGLIVIFDLYISKFLYRLFWKKHKERKQQNKLYKEVASWAEAIVFAVVAASLIHIYVFQMFKIPSSSMEKTLLIGDHLCVSKVAYGPRMQNTPLSFPLVHHTMPFSATKKSYSEAIKRPYKRLAGFGNVERDDIVVFNFPAGDTVLLQMQNATYYDVLRYYQNSFGPVRGRELLKSDYTVITRPVDKREHYVKRCVGLPGDSLYIEAGQLYVNGVASEDYAGRQFGHTMKTSMNPYAMNKLGISYADMGIDRTNPNQQAEEQVLYDKATGIYTYYHLPLTEADATKMKAMNTVESIVREMRTETWKDFGYRTFGDIFPSDSSYAWSVDNFGIDSAGNQLWVPARGTTVSLTLHNLPLYSRIIKNYEGHSLEVKDGVIYIDGAVADSYTFGMDYYFMMGDNRHFSADSRYWGFVPEDHIVGKPVFIFWSTDKDKNFPKSIRWGRIFSNPE